MTTFKWLRKQGLDDEVDAFVKRGKQSMLCNALKFLDREALEDYLREIHPDQLENDLDDEDIRCMITFDIDLDEYSRFTPEETERMERRFRIGFVIAILLVFVLVMMVIQYNIFGKIFFLLTD